VARLEECIRDLSRRDGRALIGITGPPGAGKSTIAEELGARLDAPVVPMDGFHLRNDQLEARGLRGLKGAPQTFDAPGFVELLESLRAARRDVRAPTFDRALDEPVAHAIPVPRDAPVVIVEGNYLLLDDAPWHRVRPLLDLTAWVDLETGVRVERLIERHVRHGRSRDDAIRFVHESDEANAELVARTRKCADLTVSAADPAG
jgi:pantothenate kinase